MVITPACHAGGHGFKSRQSRQCIPFLPFNGFTEPIMLALADERRTGIRPPRVCGEACLGIGFSVKGFIILSARKLPFFSNGRGIAASVL